MSAMNRKCICDLCSCGRHHCPHIPTKIYDKTEKPCLLSEYNEKYPVYHSYVPRESFKPKPEYHHGSVPMEGWTTTRRDFGAYDITPRKYHQPEKFVPNQEGMDFLTTYNQHFNQHPACRVTPIKPRDTKYLCGDKMECIPTYKSDYLPWNQPRRAMFRPQQNYQPATCRFDHKTTHQDDFPIKSLVETASCKPTPGPRLCNIPMEDQTSYNTSYVAHPVEKRFLYQAEKFKPCEIPFDDLTTHRDSYKGLMGEAAKMWKPTSNFPSHALPFPSNTEFRERFRPWPTPKIMPKESIPYVPPEGELDLLTTVQADYTFPKATRVQSCRPSATVMKTIDRFESSTTTKDDYKCWANIRRQPVKPTSQLKFPAEPMDYMTTSRAHYVPHTPVKTKSYKPVWSGLQRNIPVEGQTTYSTSFTPKEVVRCPASYSEPPGYIFEEVDTLGHRLYRPASHMASHQGSNLALGDAGSPH